MLIVLRWSAWRHKLCPNGIVDKSEIAGTKRNHRHGRRELIGQAMDDAERAAQLGIQMQYWDALGTHRTADPEALGRMIEALSGAPRGATPPPPQPPAQTRTVVRNASVMEAMLVHRVEPEYPSIAKTIHLSGTVILRARIGTDGEVHELETVSGNQLLADAARRAVMQWRYRPTMLNGQAVEVETEITVKYVLNGE